MKKIAGVSAVLLAGGGGGRIFSDKPFLKIGGKTLLDIVAEKLKCLFAELIIVANFPEGKLPYKTIADIIPACGPLGGIYTGLSKVSNPYAFVTAVDMLFINKDLIKYLAGLSGDYDVVVPRREGRPEPLCAVYSKDCLPFVKESLDKGILRISSFFDKVRVRYVDKNELEKYDPELLSFFDIDYPSELKKAKELYEAGKL